MIAVDGATAGSVDRFTLRADDGQTIVFEVGRLDVTNGLPAAHLREHLVSGEPIAVDYALDDGQFVALRYIDAPQSSEGQ